jgi:hypothetical protein
MTQIAYLNKNLALENPQAIARLDNVLDSQAIPQTPRPSAKEGERRRNSFPHDQVMVPHPNSNQCGCASDSPQTVLLTTSPENSFHTVINRPMSSHQPVSRGLNQAQYMNYFA